MDFCAQNHHTVHEFDCYDGLATPFNIRESGFFVNDRFEYEVIFGPILPGQVHLIKGNHHQFYLVKFSESNKPPFQYESYRILATNNPDLNAAGFSSLDLPFENEMQRDRVVRLGRRDMYETTPHIVKGF